MKYIITLSAVCLLVVLLAISRGAIALTETYPVHATIAGIEVNTLVDSAIASALISNNGQPLLDIELRNRLSCNAAGELPDAHRLQEITKDYSTDTATALLIQCLYQMPRVQQSQDLFLSELGRQREGNFEQAAFLSARADDYTILIVPGWGYQSSADETGADLARPREIIASLGFEIHLVAVEDFGSVEGGARILIEAIRRHSHAGKKIILASASSGGPTVALALEDPAVANNPQLVGWLNICGVLRGSPVIDSFLPWPKSLLLRAIAFFEDWKYADLLSLSGTSSKARHNSFVAPTQLTIVNYIGIPFSGQVSELGRVFYSMIKTQGPNDGLTLILDALAPGYTIMAVGTDHFVNNDPDIELKTAALVPVLLKLIEG
jgi:hypothetical protein